MSRIAERLSVLAIALAATLWATDAYFRPGLLGHLSPTELALLEDALVTLFLSPLLVRHLGELRRLSWRGWLATVCVAAGPQAAATVLFTASLGYRSFAVTYVLQQTQPLIAIVLAGLLLGERRQEWFWPWLLLALAGVYFVVFAPDLSAPVGALLQPRVAAALLALGAAALWALGTVLGRYLTATLSFPTLTSLRVTLALPMLAAVVLVTEGLPGFGHYRAADLPSFLGLALIPGVVALLLYYRALAVTPASLSSIAEMAFPVAATLIASAPAPFGFGQAIYPVQVAGTALLMVAILFVNWGRRHGIVRQRAAPAGAQAG